MTKIDIISGFLGAGKTTLIRKLLQEALSKEKVVLIENEFGEIGIDGGFLKDAGIEIKEMNSGCICCSLVGDFGASLREVLSTYAPERIIIEPSGVGKLSDVMAAVKNAVDSAQLNAAVAVVDAKKAKMYLKNFGEFFENQIAHAGTVILSRTDQLSEEKIAEVVKMIREHNAKATVITTPWPQLSGGQILDTIEGAHDLERELMEEAMRLHEEHEKEHHHHHHEHEHEHHHEHEHEHEQEHEHHHEHEHEHEHEHHHEHDHEHEHHHHHDHDADEIFTSLGIETPASYTKEEISHILSELEKDEVYGQILRAKGMVAGDPAWIYFDYTPGEPDVREGQPDVTGKICVIGAELNEEKIRELIAK